MLSYPHKFDETFFELTSARCRIIRSPVYKPSSDKLTLSFKLKDPSLLRSILSTEQAVKAYNQESKPLQEASVAYTSKHTIFSSSFRWQTLLQRPNQRAASSLFCLARQQWARYGFYDSLKNCAFSA